MNSEVKVDKNTKIEAEINRIINNINFLLEKAKIWSSTVEQFNINVIPYKNNILEDFASYYNSLIIGISFKKMPTRRKKDILKIQKEMFSLFLLEIKKQD